MLEPVDTIRRQVGLYIHFPYCIKKCPYCDFNSHQLTTTQQPLATIDYSDYLSALLLDLQYEQKLWQDIDFEVSSIFIGGGTPSLASAAFYRQLLDRVRTSFNVMDGLEITMEANPGALEYDYFERYLAAGINRLSFGVQSFNNDHLKILGRIHSAEQAVTAYKQARHAGFKRINLDLMFGLPQQSVAQGLDDLQQALTLEPEHLSWYQLTLEPNTVFYSKPPVLDHDISHELWSQGRALLAQAGFAQYEVSAYAKPQQQSAHNYLYWTFGDYMALGAGAHGKQTRGDKVVRYQKTRMPEHYMARQQRIAVGQGFAAQPFIAQHHALHAELGVEYLLNKLRLNEPLKALDYELHTKLAWQDLQPKLQALAELDLLTFDQHQLRLTDHGFCFLDEVMVRL